MLFGYSRADTMRAMHKGVHRAYATSPHDVQATIKAMYSLSYRLPTTRAQAVEHILQVEKNAYWEGVQHSSRRLTKAVGLGDITGIWEQHTGCLRVLTESA